MLAKVSPRPHTPSDFLETTTGIKTPYTVKTMRQFGKEYSRNPTRYHIKKLFKANETLQARCALAEFRVTQLQEALKIATRKTQRGKRLDLLGKEKSNMAQWFGVEEIQDAKARRDAILLAELDAKKEKEIL